MAYRKLKPRDYEQDLVTHPVSIRLPRIILDTLHEKCPPSLFGERSDFIRDAIWEKMKREGMV